MDANLVTLSGASQGITFTLIEDFTYIGRGRGNHISLQDPSTSRNHCVINKQQEVYVIKDLDSTNGIRVNGTPVRETTLQHEDRIEVGDSVFIFLIVKAETSDEKIEISDSTNIVSARPSIKLRSEEAIYLEPEKMLTRYPLTSRIAKGLDALIKITTAIQSILSSQLLAAKVLELISDAVPAERGAILWRNNESEWEMISKFSRSSAETFRVCQDVVEQVVTGNVGFVSNEIQNDQTLKQLHEAKEVHSLLAVPIMLHDQVSGVLYLDTTNSGTYFDTDHLHLTAAVATMTALALDHTKQFESLENEAQRLRQEIKTSYNMIGESFTMKQVFKFIEKVAASNSTILLHGESGTGKELVAHAIHLNSDRASFPFTVVNCATLTETLLESELFGYEKGAFTGAENQKKGKLEVGDKGTIFLDEVGELPLNLQSKLLRVLQNHNFERVGGTRTVNVDIRFVAATNKNLEECVRLGNFRQDLFYRLNVINLRLPPLRERIEDIPLLTNYFISQFSKKSKKRIRGISPEARNCLLSYEWPGNVRELENAIEHSIVLGNSEMILLEDLPETVGSTACEFSEQITNYHQAVTEARKKIVVQALQQAEGSHKKAAEILGIHPNNLGRLVRQFNLKSK